MEYWSIAQWVVFQDPIFLSLCSKVDDKHTLIMIQGGGTGILVLNKCPNQFLQPLVINDECSLTGIEQIKLFMKLWKQYGDIVYLEVGNMPFVIISGHKTLKEIFIQNSDKFCYRPNWHYILQVMQLPKGNQIKDNYHIL